MLTVINKTIAIANMNAETRIRSNFKQSPLVYVKDFNNKFTVERLRKLPARGFFRFIIPRTITDMHFEIDKVQYKIKLDSAALIFLIIIIGGIVVELTMDRATYPREYPVYLPFILLVMFIVLLIYDIVKTKKVIEQLIHKQ